MLLIVYLVSDFIVFEHYYEFGIRRLAFFTEAGKNRYSLHKEVVNFRGSLYIYGDSLINDCIIN